MRHLLLAALVAAPAVVMAQTPPLAGDWYGALKAGMDLPLIVHVQPDGVASLDSPAQGAKGLPAKASLIEGKARIDLTVPPAAFEGRLSADGKTLTGDWLQGGAKLPLVLTKDAPAPVAAPKRPQTPEPPFPYRAEEVGYLSASGLKLAGTLTLPRGEGPFPVALMITGSGAQDRDETILGHKPFLLIADRLTRKGVAVLRVDDRGIGGSALGPPGATTASFAGDVEAGVAFLRTRKDIDPARIGLIGHSEGGLIAPMVAAKDPKIAFLVLLAAPGVDGETLMLSQGRALETGSGVPAEQVEAAYQRRKGWYDTVRAEPDDAKAQAALSAQLDVLGLPAASPVRAQVLSLTQPWWRYMLAYAPQDNLKAVKAPVLAIGGSKDIQVPAAANLAAIKAALPATTDATVRELPGLNHLFQTAQTGLPGEYGALEETLAPAALDLIVNWTVTHAEGR